MATDDLFAVSLAQSAGGECQVNAVVFTCLMEIIAAMFGLAAALSWRAWVQRANKRAAAEAQRRLPVAACVYTIEFILQALLGGLPVTGSASASNGAPLAMMQLVGACHFTLVFFAVKRYVELGQKVLRLSDVDLTQPSNASSSSGNTNNNANYATPMPGQAVKQLDAVLFWLMVAQAVGVLGDVAVAIASLLAQREPRVLLAGLVLLLCQSLVTVYAVTYQLWRLYSALKASGLDAVRMRKVRRSIVNIFLVVLLFGAPAPLFFILLIGPLWRAQGAATLLALAGLVACNHLSGVLVAHCGKRRSNVAHGRAGVGGNNASYVGLGNIEVLVKRGALSEFQIEHGDALAHELVDAEVVIDDGERVSLIARHIIDVQDTDTFIVRACGGSSDVRAPRWLASWPVWTAAGVCSVGATAAAMPSSGDWSLVAFACVPLAAGWLATLFAFVNLSVAAKLINTAWFRWRLFSCVVGNVGLAVALGDVRGLLALNNALLQVVVFAGDTFVQAVQPHRLLLTVMALINAVIVVVLIVLGVVPSRWLVWTVSSTFEYVVFLTYINLRVHGAVANLRMSGGQQLPALAACARHPLRTNHSPRVRGSIASQGRAPPALPSPIGSGVNGCTAHFHRRFQEAQAEIAVQGRSQQDPTEPVGIFHEAALVGLVVCATCRLNGGQPVSGGQRVDADVSNHGVCRRRGTAAIRLARCACVWIRQRPAFLSGRR